MNSINIKIASLNVRGLISDLKRRKIFLWFEKQDIDLILIQETHCSLKNIEKIRKDWEGLSYWDLTDSHHSRGVGILIKNNLKAEIINTRNRNDGRAILLNMNINDTIITIVSIYAPNGENERCSYFRKLTPWITEHALSMDNTILGGDFNVCLNWF